MDFEIGNILYIVITLVAVIIGLLGKKKKPAGKGSETGESSAGGGFLENLEKAFNMEQGDEQVVTDLQDHEEDLPVEVFEKEPAPVSESRGMWAKYEGLHKPKDDSISKIILEGESMTEPMEVLDMDGEEGTDYFEVVKDFDAGTAVVYSAIINRVEY